MAVLAKRMENLAGSPVRAMLQASQQPGVISFAGGLPAPDSFADIALPPPPADWLQYGPTEGEPELRAIISEELEKTGLICPAERILILSGSQQGVDLVAKLMVEDETPVAIEETSYLAALQVFRLFGARFQRLGEEAEEKPRLVYVTPTFQNPTGRCWTLDERKDLAARCEAEDSVLFEDDPYRDLVFGDCERTPIAAFLKGGSFVYQGSFSKTVAPGFRLGFLAASEDLFSPLAHLKQAADLHANRLSQWYVLTYLKDPGRAQRMSALTLRYRRRRDLFQAALQRHLGDVADWEAPKGGLFFWLKLRAGLDAQAVATRALARGVLVTPGVHFEAFSPGWSSNLRLNFSHADEGSAERGLAILGQIVREALSA